MGLALLLFALPSCRDDGSGAIVEDDPPGPVAGLEVVFLDSALSEGGDAHRTAVITDPPEALAYVDGIYVGRTPFTLSFSGAHVLTLVRPGLAWHQEVVCSPGYAAPLMLPTGPVLTVSLERSGPPLAADIEAFAGALSPLVLVETDFGFRADLPDVSGSTLRGGLPSPDGRRLALVVNYPFPDCPGGGAAVLWLADLTSGQVTRLGERAFGSLGRRLSTAGLVIAGWLDNRRLAVLADEPDLVWADVDHPERYQPSWRLLVIDVVAYTVTPGGKYPGYLDGRRLGRSWTTRSGGRELVFFVASGPTDDSIIGFDVASGAVLTGASGLEPPTTDDLDSLQVSPDGLTVAHGYGLGGLDGRGLHDLAGRGFAAGPSSTGPKGPVLTAAPLWSPSSRSLAFIVGEPGRPWTWLSDGANVLLLGNAVVFSDSRGETLRRAEETARLWTRIAWSATTDTLLAVGVRVNGTQAGNGGDVLVQDGLFLIDVAGRYEWAVRGAEAARLWPFYPQFYPGWFILGREDDGGLSYFLLPERPGALPGPGTGPAGAVALPGEPAACLVAPPGGKGSPVLVALDWESDPVLRLVRVGDGREEGNLSVAGVRLDLEAWGFSPGDRPSPVVFTCGVSPGGAACLLIFTHEKAAALVSEAPQPSR